jgi:uncharacterized repeat protein (TIGR02543 family)
MKNLLITLLLVALAAWMPEAAKAQVNPDIDGRAKSAMDAFKAYSAEGQNARTGSLAAAARLKANNGNDQAMINYIASYYDNRSPGQPGYWPSLSSVAWVVGKYRDKFTPAQLENLKNRVKGLSNLASSGTENHTLNYQVAGYLFAQHWPNESGWFGGRTSAQLMSTTRGNLMNIMNSLYSKGYNEDLSTTYVATHLSPYYILYDCATDPQVKNAASAAITFHVSHIASTHFEGVVVPPFNRQNAPQFNQHNGGGWNPVLQWIYWLYWGEVQNRVPTTSHFRTNHENRWFIHAALSDWRPPAAVNSLAFGRTVPYELASTKPNFQHFGAGGAGEYLRYVYRDSLYAMGSGSMRFRPNGYHLDYSMFGLIYKSGDTFNYIDVHHDYWRSNNRIWTGASPFIQMAQHKSTSIVLFNIPATDPWSDRGPEEYRSLRSNHFNNLIREGLARYPKSIDEKVEANGWIFLREGDVYIAIRPLNSYTIDPNYSTNMTKPGDHLDNIVNAVAQYNVVRSPHAKTGFVFDVGTKGQFASFQAFQTAVRQNPITVDLNALSVTYRNVEGNTLRSTWRAPVPDYKDVPVSYNQNVGAQVWIRPDFTVNGTNVPIDSDFTGARAVIKSPSIQLVNRVLRLTTPDGNLTADWSGSNPVFSNAVNSSDTVTYNANGATSGTAPANQIKTDGVALTLATNTGSLSRTGFTFAGWNTAADGGGTNYAVGATYTGNADLSLFARWTSVPPGGEVVTETFDTATTTAANGWTGSGNTSNNNNFGWNSTDVVLGTGTGGAAGGIFARTGSFSHFADTSIAPLSRTDAIRLAGSFRLANTNYDGAFYLGYFTPGQGVANFIGIQISEPSGAAGDPFRSYVRVMGTGGAGTGIINLAQNTTLSFDLTWTGSPDGSGTLSGTLAGQSVNIPVAAGSGSFSAFGLLSGGMSNATQRTAGSYFDSLTYNKNGAVPPPPPANTYMVTYNANGATSGTVPPEQTKDNDTELTLESNNGNLARTGFTFAGWNTAANGSGTDYAAGDSYTANADLTLFARWMPVVTGPLATGGDRIEDIVVGGIHYRVHHFTNTTTHTFQVLADSLEVEYLIVGGGGGGGGLSSSNAAGAGGAGGYLSNVGGSPLSLSAGSREIVVGAGGAGGTTSGTRGAQGASSSAFGLTAIGGGGGGGNAGGQQTAGAGGSGGGHGANHTSAAAAGTAGQGNAGGTGHGGGGGAGAPGQASGTGDGLQDSITGTAVWVAGGGRGAFKSTTPLGGGGNADTSSGGNQATDGQPNTGGGGGALWHNGAKAGRSGGSGVVIVRYVVPSGNGTPFEQWAGAPDMDFAGDASGDGISNGMAFLLGASSPEDDAHQLLPAAARTAEGLALSFQMRDAASRGTASLSIEHSSDLVNWPTIPIPDSSNTSPEGVVFEVSGSGMHQVTVTIPSSHASGGKLYARLKASDR